jgi:hypothetical protein
LIGGLLFSPVFFGGIALVLVRVALGLPVAALSILLGIIFLLGAVKSGIRWSSIRLTLRNYGSVIPRNYFWQLVLWPFASALFLYNAVMAAFSSRIDWRGISYELKSPNEAVIIKRES